MNGLQCLKLLWLVFNDSEKVPEPDASTQHIFDQGHLVGELAKKLFPGGIDIPHDNFRENLNHTAQLTSGRKPLFEAGFMTGKLFCRVDILAGEFRNAINSDLIIFFISKTEPDTVSV